MAEKRKAAPLNELFGDAGRMSIRMRMGILVFALLEVSVVGFLVWRAFD